MPRALAINVAANTTLPGVRGPIYPDGSFAYVPIPEREPTAEPVPTYADLDVPVALPDGLLDRRVHLDPEFREYPHCEGYTYGDEHGVKARPIAELSAGDHLLFYATLACNDSPNHDWIAPDWGAYLVGSFRLAADPVTPDSLDDFAADQRRHFGNNAHVKRETFDARVLARGDPDGSGLFETALPLSRPNSGSEPNRVVTDLSEDSGRGPWWRRPLRFDAEATAELLGIVDEQAPERCLGD